MTVLVNLARPKSWSYALLFDILFVFGGSLFLGLMAQLALPLWFTPVPLSMLTLGVLLVGAAMGSRKGALAVAAFLVEGACGMPMFAGFSGGLVVLFGPTGGYLFGSVLAAFIVGFLLERGFVNKYGLTALSLLIGSAIILGSGTLWLSFLLGPKAAFSLGFYPFILGDLIKVGAAASLVPTAWKLCNR